MRRVSRLDLRVRELARLGYSTVLVPPGTKAQVKQKKSEKTRLVEVDNIANAVAWLRDG